VNGGTAHWSGGNARAFSSNPATRNWSGGTWNGTWNRGGHNNWGGYGYNHYGYGHNRYHNGFDGGFFGFPSYWGWGGYPYYGLGGGYYPYYNDSYSYPYYSDYGYNYAPDYSYSAPSYSSAPLGDVNTTTTAPAPQSTINDNAVLIGVRVPENAEVWIDGQKTSQTGSFREFTTPPLESGQKFIYDIKARWTENGKEVVRDRQLNFYAGDRLMVNMMAPAKQPPAQALPAPRQAPPVPRQAPPPPKPQASPAPVP